MAETVKRVSESVGVTDHAREYHRPQQGITVLMSLAIPDNQILVAQGITVLMALTTLPRLRYIVGRGLE